MRLSILDAINLFRQRMPPGVLQTGDTDLSATSLLKQHVLLRSS
jgi:hypothetical protein